MELKNLAKYLFAGLFGAEFVASNAGVVSGKPDLLGWNTETELRRAIVAQQLCNLSTQLPRGQRVLLVYPEAHWDGIKKYVYNEDKRSQMIAAFSLLRSPVTELFFEARHYKPDVRNGWQQLDSIKI